MAPITLRCRTYALFVEALSGFSIIVEIDVFSRLHPRSIDFLIHSLLLDTETVRFDVGVRNANASVDDMDEDHLGVILNIIAKLPDCRKPNKV